MTDVVGLKLPEATQRLRHISTNLNEHAPWFLCSRTCVDDDQSRRHVFHLHG